MWVIASNNTSSDGLKWDWYGFPSWHGALESRVFGQYSCSDGAVLTINSYVLFWGLLVCLHYKTLQHHITLSIVTVFVSNGCNLKQHKLA